MLIKIYYTYGGEIAGNRIKCFFRELLKIRFSGVVVNRKYYDSNDDTVLCLEEVLEKATKPIVLIVAFRDFDETVIPANLRNKVDKILRYDCWAACWFRNADTSEYEWLCSKENEFQGVYNVLQDEKSKDVFIAYLNQKISMKFGYLSAVKSSVQYFDGDLVKFGNNEIFVDCGAYDGDSALSFIRALKEQGIQSYKEIIAFEPDEINYNKLCAKNIDKCIPIKRGVSDKKETLFFVRNDTASSISENGDIKIEVDSIDNVVGNKNVTMIKMDIEGAELQALKGASETIKRCHPRLAICAYHKREDLYEFVEFISDLDSTYRFYLRCYEDSSNELVLYAL